MRRSCPLGHLPACAGETDPALCAPGRERELAARSQWLSSQAGWPRVAGDGSRRCPLEEEPPAEVVIEPEPEPEPGTEVVAAVIPRAAKPRGSLDDAIRAARRRRRR